MHGSRIVRTLPSSAYLTGSHMQVLDFCVHPKRFSDQMSEDNPQRRSRYVVNPTVIRDPTLFRMDVESRLPYYEVVTAETYQHAGFMIDDQNIVGLNVSPLNHFIANIFGNKKANLSETDACCS